jgi:DNA-binding transcriptional MerR regulator
MSYYMSVDDTMTIGELAAAAGLTRRAVRFYVQQKLLAPPAGLGRGSAYDATHLARLRQIAELQQAGHSLEAIRRILDGEPVEPPPLEAVSRRKRLIDAQLWTRVVLADGVELQFDASRHSPAVDELVELRNQVRQLFGGTKKEQR